MKTTTNLADLDWQLTGWNPDQWRLEKSMELSAAAITDIPPVPARVPGSVQASLLDAGLIPDWEHGLNARLCEWVEHRHWMMETTLPASPAGTERVDLDCRGLDGTGWVLVNGQEVGAFDNCFVPHVFDLTAALTQPENRLQIVFGTQPRWLGQYGYTSQINEWKPRFNYTWDWCPRLVQVGIWDRILLHHVAGPELVEARTTAGWDLASERGWLRPTLRTANAQGCRLLLSVTAGDATIHASDLPADQADSLATDTLQVQPWWPNGMGDQPLYRATVELVDASGTVHDSRSWPVGFKHVAWEPCQDAPADAEPWICVVNGRRMPIMGVNWTPIRANFADVTPADSAARIATYKGLGFNLIRIWGGAVLERESCYNQCDEAGILIWQETPLSSSGIDNWPPESPATIDTLAVITAAYVARRQHHASLLMWCGGNELQGEVGGGKVGIGQPATAEHPALKRIGEVVAAMDPGRRYLPTSSYGPRFMADAADYGKGLHHDVHGPWRCQGGTLETHRAYFAGDDCLIRSEVGTAGASPADIIRQYAGGLPVVPGTRENPLWRRTSWWLDWPAYVEETGHEPETLEAFVNWSQTRQAECLRIAASTCLRRYPACGGFIIWMGHDAYPITANTAILDFHGRPKPAALALADIISSVCVNQG